LRVDHADALAHVLQRRFEHALVEAQIGRSLADDGGDRVGFFVAGRGNDHTALAAQLYFWARLIYVPVYAAGIPYLRSAVWAVALWAIAQLLWALL